MTIATYPHAPGYKRGETSAEAAEQIRPRAVILRERVLALLQRGAHAADEAAHALHCSILSIRPRLSELRKRGLIEDSGERRTNDSGKRAIVWQIVKAMPCDEDGQGQLFG